MMSSSIRVRDVLIVTVLAVWGAILVQHTKLPFPYEAHDAQVLSAESRTRLLGGTAAPLGWAEFTAVHTAIAAETKAEATKNWLARVQKLFVGQIEGVESVGVSQNGTLILLDKYGYVHRAEHDDTISNENIGNNYGYHFVGDKFYIGPGRPLGYHIVEEHETLILFVCCSLKGLLRVNLSKRTIEILSNTAPDGTPINYANDLDIGPKTGTIYFSSSTSDVVGYASVGQYYDTLRSYLLDFFKGDPSGRLFAYDPVTQTTTLLLDGLFYANGVAVARDESYVLVVETSGYRVVQVWLDGPHAGTSNTLVGRLPGAPDGLSRSSSRRGDDDDTTTPESYWICLVATASPLAYLAPYPRLRQMAAHLLLPLLPRIASKILGSTAVLRVDSKGNVVRAYVDSTSSTLQTISGVTETNDGDVVFFGSLSGNYVSRMNLNSEEN